MSILIRYITYGDSAWQHKMFCIIILIASGMESFHSVFNVVETILIT